MTEKAPFYLVWNPDGFPPNHKHSTHKSAEDEAVRLARANTGKKFYVLTSTAEVVRADISITRYQNELLDQYEPPVF